ncbi:MAG: hypothetical protein KatS3mg130_1484 [Candidatus Sumerlaea sp.]|nr:MAG: hypothetical protein KatS3mg130_1484 [Candidatus Sumerlaea sp.]
MQVSAAYLGPVQLLTFFIMLESPAQAHCSAKKVCVVKTSRGVRLAAETRGFELKRNYFSIVGRLTLPACLGAGILLWR